MFIYLTTNLINGKMYVGRCAYEEGHDYLGSGVLLKQAVKKYGKHNFKRETLELLPPSSTKEDLRNCEYKWIEYFKAPDDPKFYNMSWNNGGFGKGDKFSDESLKKLSNSMKEKVYQNGLPPEWRENVANAVKGRIPWNKGKKIEYKPRAKTSANFSLEQINEIRQLYEEGIAACRIAIVYQTSHHTILKIVRYEGKYAKKEEG